jgi:DNA-binding transcriptional regulator YhcF (GntR family)
MRRKHRSNQQRFVQLFHWEMKNAAWKDLSATARALYVEIKARYHGTNNGLIGYSVRQAADELKISKATASRAFRALVSHGFIVAEQKGSFSYKMDAEGKRKRLASEWRLTAYDSDVATSYAAKLSTKEFMRWPEIHNTVSLRIPMVPEVKPYGPSGEPMTAVKALGGPSGETIKAVFRK